MLLPVNLSSLKLLIRLICIVLCTVTLIPSALACDDDTERCIFNHIMNHQYQQAKEQSRNLDDKKALIPSSDFYIGLSLWHHGVYDNNSKWREQGIEYMQNSVAQLQNSDHEKTRLLGYALAAGHSARVLLYEQRYTDGIRLGKKALDAIKAYRTSKWVDAQGLMATNILLGIVSFYKANAPKYIKRRVRRLVDLDEDASRDMIEKSATESTVFADEAKRILLMEAQWSIPRSCRYLDWATTLANRYQNNSDFSLARQGLLLRCGHAEAALKENQVATQRFTDDAYAAPLFRSAKWRALAQLGNWQALREIRNQENKSFSEEDTQRLLIALADALHLDGQIQKSKAIYQAIIQDAQTTRFHESAKARLEFGYRQPPTISLSN